jgi:nicotinamide-nucleotide amidase
MAVGWTVTSLSTELVAKARLVIKACQAAEMTVALAESCTGGLVSAALTAIPGASAWVERGFVTYSNLAKTEMLGVPEPLIERWGAVSEEVARAMAEGALVQSGASVSVAVTGIAGPTGGSPDKPVGTVHVAAAAKGSPTLHQRLLIGGDRDAVRLSSALAAMDLLIRRLRE